MKQHFVALLKNHSEFQDAYRDARRAQGIINDQLSKEAEALDHVGTIKHLEVELSIAADPEMRLAIAQKLATFKTTGEQLRASALSKLAVFANVLDLHVRAMLAQAAVAARAEREKDVDTEKAFFSARGVAHEHTTVSKRWTRLIDEINAYFEGLESHASKIAASTAQRDMHCSAFAFFE